MLRLMLLFLLCLPPVQAEGVRTLAWDDLIPTFPPLIHPLDKIPEELVYPVETLVEIRRSLAEGLLEKGSKMDQEGERLSAELKSQKIDIEQVMADFADWRAEVARRNGMMVNRLNRTRVRIPGYALPLSYRGTEVIDFLLVPYVGACIHTPPPPPNQIVYVRLKQPYEPSGLYDAVWVEGQLFTERLTSRLSFVDGEAPIQSGYRLQGVSIEPFTD